MRLPSLIVVDGSICIGVQPVIVVTLTQVSFTNLICVSVEEVKVPSDVQV